jgi:putative ABC transport system permease protein
MNLLLLLRTLQHNKIGPTLIGLQIALTLAIVCNSLFIIQQYARHMRAPTGIDENNIFTLSNSWLTEPDDLEARIKDDLTTLRGLPGVIDAVATNTYPLSGSGSYRSVSVRREQREPTSSANLYFVDEHGLAAYGLHLVAGRWFTADEIAAVLSTDRKYPMVIVVTQSLARQLFHSSPALGQALYFTPDHASRIVGIIERAQSPYVGYDVEDTIFLPLQFLNNGLNYVVRTRPGRQAQVMRATSDALYSLAHLRVLQNLRPFTDTRRRAYMDDRANSVMLVIVSALMLAVTAFGVIGLTMYWVTQRRRFIGMRRAMGARRLDILKQFHAENLLIAGGGCTLGIVLGLLCNDWLLTKLDGLQRMNPAYIISVALVVLAMCQAAVLWPALRAASVPPASAIRNL